MPVFYLLCGIMGVKYFSNPQEPVTLETVSASLEDQGAPSEEQKNANLKLNVKAAVLIDADTGKVLFEQDAHKEIAAGIGNKGHDHAAGTGSSGGRQSEAV